MELCLQFVLGFDSNNFIVISVRPVAIYNGMQVHDFIWLCIGRMAVWNLFGMLHLVTRRFGFDMAYILAIDFC